MSFFGQVTLYMYFSIRSFHERLVVFMEFVILVVVGLNADGARMASAEKFSQ